MMLSFFIPVLSEKLIFECLSCFVCVCRLLRTCCCFFVRGESVGASWVAPGAFSGSLGIEPPHTGVSRYHYRHGIIEEPLTAVVSLEVILISMQFCLFLIK